MCQAHFAIYPCNHALLAFWRPCTLATHPQNCDPRNLTLYIRRYQSDEPGLPSTCPGGKPGRPCLIVPPHPVAFAELCILKQINAEDAIALAPTWIYNLAGDKIGTRARPHRLSDYVVALYLAKNPNALHGRITSTAMLSALPIRKRKFDENEESPTKKQKTEVVGAENAAPKGESSESATETYEKGADEAKVAIKKES